MEIHTIVPYFDGSHGTTFHILTDDDRSLIEALTIIGNSPEIDWFSVDEQDGFDFHQELVFKAWGIHDSLHRKETEE